MTLPDGRQGAADCTARIPGRPRAAAVGAVDGLLALDLDRIARDPRDLEDLIDVVESRTPPIPVGASPGSLGSRMTPTSAWPESWWRWQTRRSRDTARRVSRARLGKRRPGSPTREALADSDTSRTGGPCKRSEAAEIVRATDAVLAGQGCGLSLPTFAVVA